MDVSIAADTPEPVDIEARRVSNITCDVKPRDDGTGYQVRIAYSIFLSRSLYNLYLGLQLIFFIKLKLDDSVAKDG